METLSGCRFYLRDGDLWVGDGGRLAEQVVHVQGLGSDIGLVQDWPLYCKL